MTWKKGIEILAGRLTGAGTPLDATGSPMTINFFDVRCSLKLFVDEQLTGYEGHILLESIAIKQEDH